MNIVTSSTSSRKWVMASPADPTGWPASGPPLAIWATNRLARSSDCMCTHALVHINAPAWMALIRATSHTTSAAAIQYTRELSPVDKALKPRPSSQPLSTGNVKNSTNSRYPDQKLRGSCCDTRQPSRHTLMAPPPRRRAPTRGDGGIGCRCCRPDRRGRRVRPPGRGRVRRSRRRGAASTTDGRR